MLGVLALVNIVPIAALVVIAVRWLNGDIELREEQIPEGMTQTLIWVGALLVALILVASVSLPAAHDGVRAVQAQLRRGGRVMRGEEQGSRVCVVLAWPALAVLGLAGYLARLVLILVSFVLIGLLILFVSRLRWPDLCQEQIEAFLEWGRGVYG